MLNLFNVKHLASSTDAFPCSPEAYTVELGVQLASCIFQLVTNNLQPTTQNYLHNSQNAHFHIILLVALQCAGQQELPRDSMDLEGLEHGQQVIHKRGCLKTGHQDKMTT